METAYFLGVDPGFSGGFGLIADNGDGLVYPMGETEHDTAAILQEYSGCIRLAALESVHSFPGQGIASTFKFGRSYGFLRGLLTAFKIPFVDVTPGTLRR